MKLLLISIAAVLTICGAQDDHDLRKRPHKNGGGGRGGAGRLEAMIENQCGTDATLATTCNGVEVNDLDCTFTEAVKPDTIGMDVDTRAKAKREYRAQKKECQQNLVKCMCCKGMSVEEILAARGEAGGSRPLGDGGGGGSGSRPLGGGGGGRPGKGGLFDGGSGGGKLQSMIENKCNDSSICVGAETTSRDCTFENPELQDLSDLDADGRAQLKEDFKANMDEMAKCVCCDGMPVEDVLAAARPLGGGLGGRPGGMGGFGGGSRPQGGGEGIDIQAKLEETCNGEGVASECSDMATQVVDCARFDEMMSKLDSMVDNIDSMIVSNTRGGRRKNFLFCGCCRGDNSGGGD